MSTAKTKLKIVNPTPNADELDSPVAAHDMHPDAVADLARHSLLLQAGDDLSTCCDNLNAILCLMSAARNDEAMRIEQLYHLLNPLYERLTGIDEQLSIAI